ncbi:MAG: hypothetical protein GEU71_00485 [Actinobacteria bacterium]|nr:hypothetical protein [Actinomycetota bacterium]
MKVRFSMSVGDLSGYSLNNLYRQAGMPEGAVAEESSPIWMYKEVEMDAVPREFEEVDIGLMVDLREVHSVVWNLDGSVAVTLNDFDTDEIGTEEEGFTQLLDSGWKIEIE